MQGAGDKIDVVLSLSDATGRQLWTKDFPGVRQDLLTIEDQIYNEMVTALELKPSDRRAGAKRAAPNRECRGLRAVSQGPQTSCAESATSKACSRLWICTSKRSRRILRSRWLTRVWRMRV